MAIPPELSWFATEVMSGQAQPAGNGAGHTIPYSTLIDALVQEFALHIKQGSPEAVSHFGLNPSDPRHCQVAVKAILWLTMVPRIRKAYDLGKCFRLRDANLVGSFERVY